MIEFITLAEALGADPVKLFGQQALPDQLSGSDRPNCLIQHRRNQQQDCSENNWTSAGLAGFMRPYEKLNTRDAGRLQDAALLLSRENRAVYRSATAMLSLTSKHSH